MLQIAALTEDLAKCGLDRWLAELAPLFEERTSPGAHGDLETWTETIDALPRAARNCLLPGPDRVEIRGPHLNAMDTKHLESLLKQLRPWRKGPFSVQGLKLDAEWRSDLKWARLEPHIEDLTGRTVLDVGCGNGYYAFRMRLAGAALVIGIDPTLLFVSQFAALQKLSGQEKIHVLPLRMEELPPVPAGFDTCFSMGVLYHRRDPWAHLEELHRALRDGGELVLETLVLPGDDDTVVEPDSRYARMRNVWHLPTVTALCNWLRASGFAAVRVVDVTTTSTAEQRTTRWMPFESLAEALDPRDASLTIEGLPAPTRAVVICRR